MVEILLKEWDKLDVYQRFQLVIGISQPSAVHVPSEVPTEPMRLTRVTKVHCGKGPVAMRLGDFAFWADNGQIMIVDLLIPSP